MNPFNQMFSSGAEELADSPEWEAKKQKDELSRYKNRLVDQKFNIGDYPDPLTPAEEWDKSGAPRQTWPTLSSEELKDLRELIAKEKEKVAAADAKKAKTNNSAKTS